MKRNVGGMGSGWDQYADQFYDVQLSGSQEVSNHPEKKKRRSSLVINHSFNYGDEVTETLLDKRQVSNEACLPSHSTGGLEDQSNFESEIHGSMIADNLTLKEPELVNVTDESIFGSPLNTVQTPTMSGEKLLEEDFSNKISPRVSLLTNSEYPQMMQIHERISTATTLLASEAFHVVQVVPTANCPTVSGERITSPTTHTKDDSLQRASEVRVDVVAEASNSATQYLGETFFSRNTSTASSSTNSELATGFRRASGGAVTISDEARRKAAHVLGGSLASVASNSTFRSEASLSTASTGFRRASGSAVQISDEARSKAISMLQSVSNPSTSSTVNSERRNDSYAPGGSTFPTSDSTLAGMPLETRTNAPMSSMSSGFRRASGGVVQISDEARSKAAMILKGSTDVTPASNLIRDRPEVSASMPSAGFRRANGAAVNISDEARNKALNVLQGTTAATLSTTAVSPVVDDGYVAAGFHRASGGAVQISDEARQKALSILSKSADSSALLPSDRSAGDTSTIVITTSGGFRRASGGVVNISDDARRKAAQILGDSAALAASSSTTHSSLGSGSEVATASSTGFRRASGSAVQISAAARDRAVSLLTKESGYQPSLQSQQSTWTPQVKSASTGGSSSLLQRASGRSVEISKEARARAVSLLQNSNENAKDPSTASVPPLVSSSSSSLLRKANGEAVMISEAARSKAAALMLSCSGPDSSVGATLNSTNTSSVASRAVVSTPSTGSRHTSFEVGSESDSSFRGLRKASGKAVEISAEAKARGLAFLAGDSTSSVGHLVTNAPPVTVTPHRTENSNHIITPGMVATSDFSTGRSLLQKANGKSVVISEDTRSKAAAFLSGSTSQANIVSSKPAEDIHFPPCATAQPVHDDIGARRAVQPLLGLIDQLPVPLHRQQSPHPPSCVPLIERATIERFLKMLSSDTTRDALLQDEVYLHETGDGMDDDESMARTMQRFVTLMKISSTNAVDVVSRSLDINLDEVRNSSRAVEPGILTVAKGSWYRKQLQWVIWSLVAHERKQPQQYLGHLITQDALVACLVARYRHFQRTDDSISSLTTTDPVGSHRKFNSARKPSKKCKHVSSLQRFQEICDWDWPLCVCMSVATKTNSSGAMASIGTNSHSKSPNKHSSTISTDNFHVEMTDGWWWIKVTIDGPLLSLLQTSQIVDGTKVVVFSAKFQAEDTSTVALSYNHVRRAEGSLRLGRLPLASMQRGIAIGSIKPDGGPVYAMQCLIVAKVVHLTVSAAGSGGGQQGGSKARVFLTELEGERFLESLNDQFVERLQKARDLTADYSGNRQQQQGWSSQQPDVSVNRVCGLLVQCRWSRVFAWVLLSASSAEDYDQFSANSSVLFSGLLPLKRQSVGQSSSLYQNHTTGLLTLTTTRSSSIKVLTKRATVTSGTAAMADMTSVTVTRRYGQDSFRFLPVYLLNEQQHPQQEQSLVGSYVSFTMRIFDCQLINGNSNLNNSSSHSHISNDDNNSTEKDLEEVEVHLFGLTTYGLTVCLRCFVFASQLRSLTWTKVYEEIRVQYALVSRVDGQCGIVHADKVDVTMVSMLSSTSARGRIKLLSSNTNCNSGTKKSASGANGTIGSAWRVLCDSERARMEALRSSETGYQAPILSPVLTSKSSLPPCLLSSRVHHLPRTVLTEAISVAWSDAPTMVGKSDDFACINKEESDALCAWRLKLVVALDSIEGTDLHYLPWRQEEDDDMLSNVFIHAWYVVHASVAEQYTKLFPVSSGRCDESDAMVMDAEIDITSGDRGVICDLVVQVLQSRSENQELLCPLSQTENDGGDTNSDEADKNMVPSVGSLLVKHLSLSVPGL